MSMRASFTTEFIYDGADGFEKRRNKLIEIFGADKQSKGGSMIGRITGITSGLDLAENDIRRWIEEMCNEAYHIAKVDFTIVWLLEGGDIYIKKIFGKPNKLINKEDSI